MNRKTGTLHRRLREQAEAGRAEEMGCAESGEMESGEWEEECGRVESKKGRRVSMGMSRQRQRAILFQEAFGEISRQYGGELRKQRRRMARRLGKRRWRQGLRVSFARAQ